MTASKAIKEWHISAKTLCRYLENGIIRDVKINNNTIIIPDIPKPLVPAYNAVITKDKVVHYILKALNTFQYIDYRILFIEDCQFSAIMKQMEEKKYIERIDINADYYSTIGFSLTDEGVKKLSARCFNLKELTFKLGFKYNNVYGEFNINLIGGGN